MAGNANSRPEAEVHLLSIVAASKNRRIANSGFSAIKSIRMRHSVGLQFAAYLPFTLER